MAQLVAEFNLDMKEKIKGLYERFREELKEEKYYLSLKGKAKDSFNTQTLAIQISMIINLSPLWKETCLE